MLLFISGDYQGQFAAFDNYFIALGHGSVSFSILEPNSMCVIALDGPHIDNK